MASPLPHPHRLASALTVVALAIAGVFVAGTGASADSLPSNAADPATPATVTADALPTPQIDGVVWTQTISGTNVFAGGNFRTIRPSGRPPGSGTVNRPYLMSYNVTNGLVNTRFAPVLNGQVRSIVATADGKRLYIAGAFTKVGTVAAHGIAEIDAATGAIVTAFRPAPNHAVDALALRGNTIWLGGPFTAVSGKTRLGLASVNATTGGLNGFSPRVTGGSVGAIAVAPDGSKIVIGGSFTQVDGRSDPGYGLAALQPSTGAMLPWAMDSVIRNGGVHAAITSLTPDATGLYGSGYVYGTGGNLEGTFRADWKTGALTWMEDCHGDSYSTAVTPSALYVAGHAHDCSTLGGFTQAQNTIHHAIAFGKSPTQTLSATTNARYSSFAGKPAPSLLNWFPDFTAGTFTGLSQATWSVAANSQYVVYGGEFTNVNGIAQQGLVRFAVASLAPNKMGPIASGASLVPSATATSTGGIELDWTADADEDNSALTYSIFRNGDSSQPVAVLTSDSSVWRRPQMTWTDTDVVPGQTYSYRIAVSDAFGNSVIGDGATVTTPGPETPSPDATGTATPSPGAPSAAP